MINVFFNKLQKASEEMGENIYKSKFKPQQQAYIIHPWHDDEFRSLPVHLLIDYITGNKKKLDDFIRPVIIRSVTFTGGVDGGAPWYDAYIPGELDLEDLVESSFYETKEEAMQKLRREVLERHAAVEQTLKEAFGGISENSGQYAEQD